ncbi:MAG: helix-turn-helix transcriptional regulator [Rhodothermales bacterium]|nr:helix-turn-helix transcriptional regulator [Rhodothermales bacterium]MBO6778549.1 helix-turn-helix transcriptional regulator [Rhodothermales bacterium]
MFSRELSAAAAKPAILAILADRDSYGYEIILRVKDLSGGRVEWAEGAIYPVLHRLERQGFIESYWEKGESGHRRKYYRLLPKGRRESAREEHSWRLADAILTELWSPKPSLGLR